MKNKISVIIPIYNELNNLPNLLERLHESLSKIGEYELIFIDDHSTDKTSEYFKKFKADNIFLHLKKGKKGKAYSLVEGFEKATGDVLVMIDADLQYPPEKIPDMIKLLETNDVVVANRKTYKDAKIRKFLSRGFKHVFGKLLFGLDLDIQSGLKVFKKEVIETLQYNPSSQWSFDLEFLYRASHAGFLITNFDIEFEGRKKGESSINLLKTSLEIGLNALILKTKKINPIKIPSASTNMIGAGIRYKKKHYITHTTLSHEISALNTFTLNQKVIIFSLILYLLIGLIFKPLLTLQLTVGILSFIYFVDVFFNLYLIIKSLSFPQEVSSSQEEIESLKDKDLPVYSILCPLYKESHVIPQFLDAISKLDWPKKKLDVILLLEEDDKVSIEAVEKMDMPSYVRTIIVPDSQPKTKPKACNYGLAFAKGEYLVIYDAEDVPDPLQLKKAFLGFKKVSDKTICLQAKLNYYNPHQNLLTRFFTAEYSLWFDVTLTGLQSIETTIPLGGTSNHFKIKYLHEVEGWDPFNVTEDADLGIRLFKKGYKTAIIDSVTLEEANSKYKNWLRQRSRWIKGYMQTYLVHVRDLFTFTKNHKRHSLIFQLIVGGKITFVLINPLLWIATFAYFALYALVGPQIEKLYPSVVFYMAVVSLVLGNFLFLYYYMIGVAKKGQWALMKYVFLIPFYWLMISIAAIIALYQLILKPHYWEKTVHGLHLIQNKPKQIIVDEIVAGENIILGGVFSKFIKNKITNISRNNSYLYTGGILITANILANIINYLFSTFMGRRLNFIEFGELNLITTFSSLFYMLFSAITISVGYKIGYLDGKLGENSSFIFWRKYRKIALFTGFLASIIWIASIPFLMRFFNIDDVSLFVLFIPVILFGFAGAVDMGALSGKLFFLIIASINLFEPILKLISGIFLININAEEYVYSSIVIGFLFVFFWGWIYLYHKSKNTINNSKKNEKFSYPFKVLSLALLSGISTTTFLTVDVILAKHFLSPEEAGKYALISIIGKSIYFLGSLFTQFIIPFASRFEGEGKDSKSAFNIIFILTGIFSFIGFLTVGVLGKFIAPILFGSKAIFIIPYLFGFSFGVFSFTLSRVFITYYLTKKTYLFSVFSLLLAFFQSLIILLFHQNLYELVFAMMMVGLTNLCVMSILHIKSNWAYAIESNLNEVLNLFKFRKPLNKIDNDKLNILIFNWRDVKHSWSGGAEVYLNELARRWVQDGNNVTLFCGNDGKSAHDEIIDGIQIYRRGGFYTVYIWALLYYLFKFSRKYDVIIDSENGIPFFTPLYSLKPKFLLIHHVHQEVFRKSLKWPLSWIALFLEAKLMPLIYRNVQVITVSPSSRDEILKHKLTKKDPIIIYNGVDLNIFKPGTKSKNPLVLYLGRLQYYKSLHVFIIAAKRLLKVNPNIEFIIAGEGEEKEKLIKFAKDQNIEFKIKFLGKVSLEEKISLFKKAWVFVNPSFMEGWGITTIEANACSTPAVASNVPGLKDSIKHGKTGILEKYGKYNGFKKSILKIIENYELRKELSENARKWSENFDWENSASKFYAILYDAAQQNKKKRVRQQSLNYVLTRIISLF